MTTSMFSQPLEETTSNMITTVPVIKLSHHKLSSREERGILLSQAWSQTSIGSPMTTSMSSQLLEETTNNTITTEPVQKPSHHLLLLTEPRVRRISPSQTWMKRFTMGPVTTSMSSQPPEETMSNTLITDPDHLLSQLPSMPDNTKSPRRILLSQVWSQTSTGSLATKLMFFQPPEEITSNTIITEPVQRPSHHLTLNLLPLTSPTTKSDQMSGSRSTR